MIYRIRSVSLERALTACVVILAVPSIAIGQSAQEHVHHMGSTVMPFDLSTSIHVFKMTETGGVERVVTRDPGSALPDQIVLIRRHLEHEAKEFQAGRYSDPAALHGAGMPGLADLAAGAGRIKVTYGEVSGGAQLTFETTDVHLLTAIHRWFGAQLSEHGADARAE